MEFLPWEYIKWDEFNSMHMRVVILGGLACMLGSIGIIFGLFCAGQIDSLRKRIKVLEEKEI